MLTSACETHSKIEYGHASCCWKIRSTTHDLQYYSCIILPTRGGGGKGVAAAPPSPNAFQSTILDSFKFDDKW